MNVTLQIPESLFARIQKHAIPFVDLTPISVIERWADHFEGKPDRQRAHGSVPVSESDLIENRFDPVAPPDLMHTRCRGTLGNVSFRKWNELLRIAHIQALKKAQSFESLRKVTRAQIREGDHSGDSGYHFIPEIGVSVQGVDANHAWEYALHLARYLKAPLRVSIEWRHNDKAAFPGGGGLIEWTP